MHILSPDEIAHEVVLVLHFNTAETLSRQETCRQWPEPPITPLGVKDHSETHVLLDNEEKYRRLRWRQGDTQ